MKIRASSEERTCNSRIRWNYEKLGAIEGKEETSMIDFNFYWCFKIQKIKFTVYIDLFHLNFKYEMSFYSFQSYDHLIFLIYMLVEL